MKLCVPPTALKQLLDAYDRGLLACNARDFRASHRAIGVLRAALVLDTEESRAFDSLFEYCEMAIDRGDFADAARCLGTLRGAWQSAALIPAAPCPPVHVPASANAQSRRELIS